MTLQVVTAGQFLDELPEQMPWIIEPLCTHGSSVMLYGRQKVGKSSAIMQLVHSLTTGEPWMGFRVHQTGNVLYLQLDMAQLELSRIIWRATRAGFSVRDQLYIPKPAAGEHRISFDVLQDTDWRWLHDTCREIEPIAVIVDTINDAYTSIEHGDINAFIRLVHRRFMEAIGGATLIFLNHKRKQMQKFGRKNEDDSDDDEDGYLGGSAWAGVVASNIELARHRTTRQLYLVLRDLRLDAYPTTRIPLQKDENGFFKPVLNSQQMLVLWPDCLPADERATLVDSVVSNNDVYRDIAERCQVPADTVKKQAQRAAGVEFKWEEIVKRNKANADEIAERQRGRKTSYVYKGVPNPLSPPDNGVVEPKNAGTLKVIK